MQSFRKAAQSLAILSGTVVAVLAGPPLVTDDAETPGQGGWEVNLSHNIEKTRDRLFMESPLFDVNYGFRDNDQFKVEFAVVSDDAADEPSHWGVGDLLIGYKYRFLDEERVGLTGSVYPQVTAPTGNRRLGLGGGDTELLTPFQIGKHLCEKRLFMYGELGYNVVFDEPEINSWKFGVAAEWKMNEKTELLGEVAGFTFPQSADPDDVFFNLGLKHELHTHAGFIASAGRSFYERDHGTPEFISFIGLQLTWGGDSKTSKSTANAR